jgi:hypothetical protein
MAGHSADRLRAARAALRNSVQFKRAIFNHLVRLGLLAISARLVRHGQRNARMLPECELAIN